MSARLAKTERLFDVNVQLAAALGHTSLEYVRLGRVDEQNGRAVGFHQQAVAFGQRLRVEACDIRRGCLCHSRHSHEPLCVVNTERQIGHDHVDALVLEWQRCLCCCCCKCRTDEHVGGEQVVAVDWMRRRLLCWRRQVGEVLRRVGQLTSVGIGADEKQMLPTATKTN